MCVCVCVCVCEQGIMFYNRPTHRRMRMITWRSKVTRLSRKTKRRRGAVSGAVMTEEQGNQLCQEGGWEWEMVLHFKISFVYV